MSNKLWKKVKRKDLKFCDCKHVRNVKCVILYGVSKVIKEIIMIKEELEIITINNEVTVKYPNYECYQ